MPHIVLDASVMLSILLNEQHPYAERILKEYLMGDCMTHVPYLWHLEIRNILILKEKKGVIAPTYTIEALQTLRDFLIRTDQPIDQDAALTIIDSLARDEHITTYDACYCELALRLGIPLATLDDDLANVAKKFGFYLSV